MKGTIVGKGEVLRGEKSRKTGNPYHCATFHLHVKKPKVEGTAVKEQYISFLDYPALLTAKIGDTLELDFDDGGFLLDISIAKPASAPLPAPKAK